MTSKAFHRSSQTPPAQTLPNESAGLKKSSDQVGKNEERNPFGTNYISNDFTKNISKLVKGEASFLWLLKEGYAELVVFPDSSEKPPQTYQLALEMGEGLFGKCIHLRTAFIKNQIPPDEEFHLLDAYLGVEIDSILCVPLVINQAALGVAAVVNKPGSFFDSRDQELFEIFAETIAQTTFSEQLIQQLQIANADLEASQFQLINSRNTLRALFDSIPTSIYIIDKKFTLISINMHRARMTGSPPNLLVGRRCYEALFHEDEICADCKAIDTLFGGESTVRKKRKWQSDGEPLEWEITTYPISDDTGEIRQAIILEQDVTEKRRLEATLVQSEKLAAVGQLAAGIAHEINNPLTAIVANAQLLQRELPVEDDKQELVDLIVRAGGRAAQVVRNLLDLARKEHYEFTPTDLNETIRQSLALLQHEITIRSIDVIFEPCEDLPKVRASQDHLEGVWINLLTNAIDALENGNREIRVYTRQQGNEVRVIVADTGNGIPPERMARIFEPFYSTKAPGRGTGLGLSVCQRIISQHGGRIFVDSQHGMGTQFTVVLPVS